MSAAPRSTSLLLLLAAASFACGPARAGEPEPPPPEHAPAAHDTSGFLPRGIHFYGSAGGSWIAAPVSAREHTEVGECFEGGLEARPLGGLGLHLGAEYQVMPIRRSVTGILLEGFDVEGNPIGTPFTTEESLTGALLGVRMETQWRLLPGTWLLGGGGMAHISTRDPNSVHAGTVYTSGSGQPILVLHAEGPDLFGWASSLTLGMRQDFDFLGPLLGIEVRYSAMANGSEQLRTGSVRIGWGGTPAAHRER
jgi:hypothetical protein